MKAEKMLVTGSAGFIGFHSLVNLDNLQKANGPCFGVVLVKGDWQEPGGHAAFAWTPNNEYHSRKSRDASAQR